MSRTPDFDKPLPDCEGPKLHPFKHRKAAIKFHRLLSDTDMPQAGGDSHVFEVSIRSKVYALKVFKFYDDTYDRGHLSLIRRENVFPLSLVHAHRDPFYNECRAYGRLEETGLNGKIAARCYGHLILPTKEEDKINDFSWGRPEEDLDKPASERSPLRAIVKELIGSDVSFTAKEVNKLLRHLRKLRRLGIYNMDIAARNYKGGLLIDFSRAMTEPHYYFDIESLWAVRMEKSLDLVDFDIMMEDEGIKTWVRASPNPAYLRKLRPRPQSSKCSGIK